MQGSVWAPDRPMVVSPELGTDVAKGSKVRIEVAGDWLCGPEPAPQAVAW